MLFVVLGLVVASAFECPPEKELGDDVMSRVRTIKELSSPNANLHEFGYWSSPDYRSRASHVREGSLPLERIKYEDLTDERWDEIETRGEPVMLLDIPEREGWQAMEKWESLEEWRNVSFKCANDENGTDLFIPLQDFLEYSSANCEDSPLYIFDDLSVSYESTSKLRRDYDVPRVMRKNDLLRFSPNRPPYRWFLVGPERSGTTVHIDPLGTSAWNTLIKGHKRWIIFPPETEEDVVKSFKAVDEASMFFVEVVPKINPTKYWEFVQVPGETLFVPSGYWHGVLNLDETVAITHNWASPANFNRVWDGIRRNGHLIAKGWLEALLRSPHPADRDLAIRADITDPLATGYQKVYCENDELVYTSGCTDASCYFCSGRRYRASAHAVVNDTIGTKQCGGDVELIYRCEGNRLVVMDCLDGGEVIEPPVYVEDMVSISDYHYCYNQESRDPLDEEEDQYDMDAWDESDEFKSPPLPLLERVCTDAPNYVAAACMENGRADDDCCAPVQAAGCAPGFELGVTGKYECDAVSNSFVTCCYKEPKHARLNPADEVDDDAGDEIAVYSAQGWCDSPSNRELPYEPSPQACWKACFDLLGAHLVAADMTEKHCFCQTACYCLNEVGVPQTQLIVRNSFNVSAVDMCSSSASRSGQ